MNRLKNIEQVVENILETKKQTRENDDMLYLHVCAYFYKGSPSMTLRDFLKTRNMSNCPSFASVTRVRRKIFEKRPELKPKEITEIRERAVEKYVDYAQS